MLVKYLKTQSLVYINTDRALNIDTTVVPYICIYIYCLFKRKKEKRKTSASKIDFFKVFVLLMHKNHKKHRKPQAKTTTNQTNRNFLATTFLGANFKLEIYPYIIFFFQIANFSQIWNLYMSRGRFCKSLVSTKSIVVTVFPTTPAILRSLEGQLLLDPQ